MSGAGPALGVASGDRKRIGSTAGRGAAGADCRLEGPAAIPTVQRRDPAPRNMYRVR